MTPQNLHTERHSHEPWRELPEGFADYLALEATLSTTVVDAAINHGAAALGSAPSTVLDLGSGAGGATIALAQRFPEAQVHGLDVSSQLLDRLTRAATAANVHERVQGHRVDLEHDWTGHVPSGVDLVWAALSLHHVSDPGAVLQQVFTSLRTGGVLVVTELTGQEVFHSQDEVSLGDNLRRKMESARPGHHHGSIDWSTLLTAAGFAAPQLHEQELIVRADTAEGRQYLAKQLLAYRQGLSDETDGQEIAEYDSALAALEADASTLLFRSGRAIWVATRPHTEPLDDLADVSSEKTADRPSVASELIESAAQAPAHLEADVAVIGGGAAGLAAANALARSRRSVVVIDAGAPRNAAAEGAHNVLGHEGISPLELLARGRKEAAAYGVQVLTGRVTEVSGTVDHFTVDVDAGTRTVHARRVVFANGVVDKLPAIPGLEAGWGHTVLHCPFCHGWEVRDQRIAVIASDERALHQAMLFGHLSEHVTVFLNDAFDPTQEQHEQLVTLAVDVVAGRVERVVVEGTQVNAVELADGRVFATDAVVVAPDFNARTELYESLGGIPEIVPFGRQIPTNQHGMTEVPGVWAAGNANQPMAMVAACAAAGVTTGTALHGELLMTDLNQAGQGA